ncbi:hypothetical protein ACO0LO_08360 [Undibacterium sp. TJN25]|uniref:hypothetical protein n=1 Tax=Undibacterium sp. TJN25 TaxID=3413056 RepID=UPI003BF03C66
MNQNISRSSVIPFPFPPDEFSAELQSPGCAPAKQQAMRQEPSARVTHISYRNKPKAIQNDFIMRITVDAASVTELRHVIVGTCGELVSYMRVKPVDHATKMKVWLCLSKNSVDTIIRNVMRSLPQAEFGRITPLLPV